MANITSKAQWIWRAGDFEIRQALLQNLQREERQFDWPAYWHIADCCKSVIFSRQYCFARAERFFVQAEGKGYVSISGKKYPLNQTLCCPPGQQQIAIYVAHPEGLPCIYIDGENIYSDSQWTVSDYIDAAPAGCDELYRQPTDSPNTVNYHYAHREPETFRVINGGVLYDFVHMVNGKVDIRFNSAPVRPLQLCYGESSAEALNTELCYYRQDNVTPRTPVRKRAFRYLFIPDCTPDEITLTAEHEFIQRPLPATFSCNDPLINDIWSVAAETFTLCSDLFFIDGVKRDRWIWSGDAWQCSLINQYLFFDEALNRRTLLALRGHDPVRQHINTIVDYSLLWIINIENHYLMSNDVAFLRQIYPRMVSLMDWIAKDTDEKGFIRGKEGDWIFIDWAEIDKTGAVCAEQFLLLKAWQSLSLCARAIGEEADVYNARAERLAAHIEACFWHEEKGAFIDSFESGKQNVTRHANIFAVLFNLVSPERRERIINAVLLNDRIPHIVTPYFTFFELDTLCQSGQQAVVWQRMRDYWGGMLALGATTFWEAFDPSQKGNEHYSMYGDAFGKSLCHAWGASPVYLLSRYFIGLRPLTPGYETFVIEPWLQPFTHLECTLPVKDGTVHLTLAENTLTVTATRAGGCVCLHNQRVGLEAHVPVRLSVLA